MAKKQLNGDNYLDNKKTLRTPLNSYNKGLEILEQAEKLKSSHDIKMADAGYHTAMLMFSEALLFGEAAAAQALAYLYYHGYGVKQDLNKVKLYIAMGKSLGDEACIKYMQGIDDEIFDIGGFLSSKPVYSNELLIKATNYAKACAKNANKYPTNNTVIGNKDVAEATVVFESADPSHALDPLGKALANYNNQQQYTANHHYQFGNANDNARYETKEAEPSAPDPEEGQPRRGYEPDERKPSSPHHHNYYNSTDPSAPPPSYAESQASSSSYSKTKTNDSPPSAASSSSSSSSVYNSSLKLNLAASNYANSNAASATTPVKVKVKWEVMSDGSGHKGVITTDNGNGVGIGYMHEKLVNMSSPCDVNVNGRAKTSLTKYPALFLPTEISGLKQDFHMQFTHTDTSCATMNNYYNTSYLNNTQDGTYHLDTRDYLKISYHLGRLVKISLPKIPVVFSDDKDAPVFIMRPEIKYGCVNILPITSEHYKNLCKAVLKNGGKVEFDNTDPVAKVELHYNDGAGPVIQGIAGDASSISMLGEDAHHCGCNSM